jgi:hypothetical protein
VISNLTWLNCLGTILAPFISASEWELHTLARAKPVPATTTPYMKTKPLALAPQSKCSNIELLRFLSHQSRPPQNYCICQLLHQVRCYLAADEPMKQRLQRQPNYEQCPFDTPYDSSTSRLIVPHSIENFFHWFMSGKRNQHLTCPFLEPPAWTVLSLEIPTQSRPPPMRRWPLKHWPCRHELHQGRLFDGTRLFLNYCVVQAILHL